METKTSVKKSKSESWSSLTFLAAPQPSRNLGFTSAPRTISGVNMSNLKSSSSEQFSKQMPLLSPRSLSETSLLHSTSNTIQRKFSLPSIREPPREPVTKTDKPPQKTKRKKMKPSVIKTVKPDNLVQERQTFMKSEFKYNPMFTYSRTVHRAVLHKHGPASSHLLPVAMKILNKTLKKYGTYGQYEKSSGGRILSGEEVMAAARDFMEQENLVDDIRVRLSDDMVSRACVTRVRGQPTLMVQPNCMRSNWVYGMLRHEVGTHFIRSYNDRLQEWRKPKRRRSLHLLPMNPTEEGLACLHTILLRDDPLLWRAALLYYAVYRASQMSFRELFEDLSQFMSDTSCRWDYCLRAKRGLSDTSQPGAFTKDQIYLQGACEILKQRNELDFHLLVSLGKVSHRDVERLRPLANMDNTKIPSFMLDQELYRQRLEHILHCNGLTDDDLKCAHI